MKNLLPFLLAAVMLRVWWPDYNQLTFFCKAGSGIVIGVEGHGETIVRKSDGKIVTIPYRIITKSKWVEVEAEK